MTSKNLSPFATDLNIFFKIHNSIPAFNEIFDEESFYWFAFFFAIVTILVAIILSRFIKLEECDY